MIQLEGLPSRSRMKNPTPPKNLRHLGF